ncbi:hypothetical protein ACP4OV_013052 [Aristida adscensionis]
MPLHSAVASARLRSAISPESQSWGLVPQGVILCLYDSIITVVTGNSVQELFKTLDVFFTKTDEVTSSHETV